MNLPKLNLNSISYPSPIKTKTLANQRVLKPEDPSDIANQLYYRRKDDRITVKKITNKITITKG